MFSIYRMLFLALKKVGMVNLFLSGSYHQIKKSPQAKNRIPHP